MKLNPFSGDKEYVLLVQLITRQKEGLLEANYEMAFEQFVLQEFTSKPLVSCEDNSPNIILDDNNYIVENNVFKLSINRKSGEINHWSFNGALITENAIKPNFWRPPTDNDLGNGMQEWAKIWQQATNEATSTLIEKPKLSKYQQSKAKRVAKDAK